MSEQVIFMISDYIINKSMNRNTHLVNYIEIENEMNIPSINIKMLAKQICKCVLKTRIIVDDCDCVDNEYFDVMLRKTVNI